MPRTFTQRMVGAAALDVPTYEEIEHDRNATGQAAAVVAIAAAASAIGSIGAGGATLIGGVVTAFVGWIVWAFITLIVGTWLFNGRADLGEMLRTLGFATAPGILYIVGVLPILGGLVGLVVWAWMLACGVVAIRQALDFTTGKAIATALIGLVPYIVARAVLSGLTFGLL